jgi:hypothetical protein
MAQSPPASSVTVRQRENCDHNESENGSVCKECLQDVIVGNDVVKRGARLVLDAIVARRPWESYGSVESDAAKRTARTFAIPRIFGAPLLAYFAMV